MHINAGLFNIHQRRAPVGSWSQTPRINEASSSPLLSDTDADV